MSKQIQIEILSLEHEIFSGKAYYLVALGVLGELAIYPNHMPLLTALKPGPVRIVYAEQQEEVFYVSGGILIVKPTLVTLLADTAVRAAHLDEAAAINAQERATQMLSDRQADINYAAVAAELAQAAAQLHTIRQMRRRIVR